ncbi:pyrophosphatase [candidate division TA06 bacterium SM23_40]|uniref:Pyrophosphatase n=1 Tax=candidate division TA06 bacterium SM23_40 TaxID=1703774 RepID=A0A0S8G5G6_UNCT6|nr:MAG: pyrophosphatase [candidate division TA06 bacterium SM23_40]
MGGTNDVFSQLVDLVDRLRGETGCPWDREQTHETLKPYLLEEAHEVIEALEEGSDERLKDELGDVLFQVLFHAQIAKEEGRFTIDDVLRDNLKKMRRRHPHVFGAERVSGPREVLVNWEQIKRQESPDGRAGSLLDGVPKGLSALLRAHRIQDKVSRVGFDWNDPQDVMRKVEEELQELSAARRGNEGIAIREELGDLLFAIVNLARLLNVNPEDALKRSTDKFIARFKQIEESLRERGSSAEAATLEEMEQLWNLIKGEEQRRKSTPGEQ